MSAETLRRAAALMRERAEAATPSPWEATVWGVRTPPPERSPVAPFDGRQPDMENRLYIASWHPAVALAVADWLDEIAAWMDEGVGLLPMTNIGDAWMETRRGAVAVARAYLGES